MKKKGGAGCGAMYAGKRRKSRRGGAVYGAGQPLAVGALEYGAAYTGPVNSAGAAVPDPTDPAGGYTGIGGRRRTRKGGKKSRKTRKTRKMRGGSSQISAMKAGYGFNGSGAAGLADAVPAPTSGGNPY